MDALSVRQFSEMFGLNIGTRLAVAIDETGTMGREITGARERSRVNYFCKYAA